MSQETLDRLAVIIGGLAPLGNAGPGEPVRAADWNAIVGAVQELARIAIARERSTEEVLSANFARVGHTHDGEVTLDWFDPDTRSLVEGGRAQRADLASELGRTQRDLREVQAAAAALRTELDAIRNELDEISGRDRDRLRGLDRLSARVEGFADNATSIADLRQGFTGIDARVTEALGFRDQLVDLTGAPINLANLRADVTELLQIRENLTASDGRLVQYRDFERRVVALEEREPGGGGGPPFDVDRFRVEVLDAAFAQATPRFDEVESRFGDLSTSVNGFDQRITTVQQGVTTHTNQIGALQASTAGITGLTSRTATLETRVSVHDTRIGSLEPLRDRLTAAETSLAVLPQLQARIAATETDIAGAQTRLGRLDDLNVRLTKIESSTLGGLRDRVGALETGLEQTRSGAAASNQRLVVLEAQADDTQRRFTQVETLATSNRQSLTLLTRDLQDIRKRVPERLADRPGGLIT